MLSNLSSAPVFCAHGGELLAPEPTDGAGMINPPCGALLGSVTSKRAPFHHRAGLSMLPTTLTHLINTWLIPGESLQLLLTSHSMRHEIEEFYRMRLRPAVLGQSASPMFSCRDSVNILPSFLGMGKAGELLFQECLAMKARGLPETQYYGSVIDVLRLHLSETNDLDLVREAALGSALGLGGNLMTDANRDALLTCILELARTSGSAQMGSMLQGVCLACGGPNIKDVHLQALLRRILASCKTSNPAQMRAMIIGLCSALGPKNRTHAVLKALIKEILGSYKTSSPTQMGAMIQGVCQIFGNRNMSAPDRMFVIAKIAASCDTSNREQIGGMTHHVCLALGGKNISPDSRDALTQQILLTFYGVSRRIALTVMLRGLCRGMGEKAISVGNLDAVLHQILLTHGTLDGREMGVGISSLCSELGGMEMSAIHRDTVAAKILASHATSNSGQMGAMMWGLCYVLGGATSDGANRITQRNLDALIRQILQSHATSSQQQVATMLHYLYRTLGSIHITPVHRGVLVARIRDSGRLPVLLTSLKLMPGGRAVVNTLQLEPPGSSSEKD